MLRWLYSRSHDNADTLEALFDKYIPPVIDFMGPVLTNSAINKTNDNSTVSVSEKMMTSHLESQELMLSEVHVMNTCCQVLEVRGCVVESTCTYYSCTALMFFLTESIGE